MVAQLFNCSIWDMVGGRSVSLWPSSPRKKFQASQGCTVRPCLKTNQDSITIGVWSVHIMEGRGQFQTSFLRQCCLPLFLRQDFSSTWGSSATRIAPEKALHWLSIMHTLGKLSRLSDPHPRHNFSRTVLLSLMTFLYL